MMMKITYNQINEYENDSNINDDSDLGSDEILTIEQIENEYNDDDNNNKRNENDNCWNTDEIKLKEMKLEEFSLTIIDPAIQKCKEKIVPSDYNDSLNGIECIIPIQSLTKGDFAKSMLNFCKTTNMNNSNIGPLFKIIHNFFPNANLPMTISKNGNIIPKLNDYETLNIPVIEFDVCINSCCVFAGNYIYVLILNATLIGIQVARNVNEIKSIILLNVFVKVVLPKKH
jgi:hypothetical protein